MQLVSVAIGIVAITASVISARSPTTAADRRHPGRRSFPHCRRMVPRPAGSPLRPAADIAKPAESPTVAAAPAPPAVGPAKVAEAEAELDSVSRDRARADGRAVGVSR